MRVKALKYELPTTVDEVADLLVGDLSLRERTELARMESDKLAEINESLGPYIIEEFKLFTGNFILLDDCTKVADNNNLKHQDPSLAIVHRVWEKLKKTHRLRLVK